MTPACGACAGCLRRAWLLERLAGHLEQRRANIDELLALGDRALIDAVGGGRADALAREWSAYAPSRAAGGACAPFGVGDSAWSAGLRAVCLCDPRYPPSLRELAAPPATLFLAAAPGAITRGEAGGVEDVDPIVRLARLLDEPAVAIVGARRASPYGRELARELASGVAAAGVTVISGLALGIDSAAHAGALQVGGRTIAVMPGGADRAYPASRRRLHREVQVAGLAISEMRPGLAPRRWMFPARNRIIAALSAVTIVVQARSASGALLTAGHAGRLGRVVAAVPGPVTTPQSAGPHRLLADGARLVTSAQDVLDLLFGPGARSPPDRRTHRLTASEAALRDAIADGHEGPAAFAAAGLGTTDGITALASLELAGLVKRTAGGRLAIVRDG